MDNLRTNNQETHNMSIITEQGDLGLGTRELTDEEQEQVNKQKDFYRNQKKSQWK